MNCLNCDREPTLAVPLLTCGCYYCPACYCIMKSNRIYNCLAHDREMVRGRKRNAKCLVKNNAYKSLNNSAMINIKN